MKPYNILIIENHALQLTHVQHIFRELGDFNIRCALGAKEGLERLHRMDFDLVLTELLMPSMDGVQFIQALAKLRTKPALAIMSSTSRRMLMGAGLVARSLDLDVIGLISKPITRNSIRKVIEALVTQNLCSEPDRVLTHTFDRQMMLQAMSDGQIQAWFQPKKSLSNGRIAAAEALVRWQHPKHGALLPGAFLPALKALELEEHLLWHMLKQALKAQASWRDQGYDIPVSVNLPTHLLNSHDLADRLQDFVLRHGGVPGKICFELMECSLPEDISNFYAGACRLRIKGFGLSQDDFGKGYSSYMHLVSTPFTELKIDRALVHGCHNNEGMASALASIVSLGQKLGLTVVAEGVETPQELELLRRIDCSQAQGFLISEAVSSEQFQLLLNNDGLVPSF